MREKFAWFSWWAAVSVGLTMLGFALRWTAYASSSESPLGQHLVEGLATLLAVGLWGIALLVGIVGFFVRRRRGRAVGSVIVAVLVGLLVPAASWALLVHRPTHWEFVNAAASGDNKEVLRALEREVPIDGFNTSAGLNPLYGETALFAALRARQMDTVRLLLDRGASARARNMSGETPLGLAVSRGNGEAARLLLARGADANEADSQGHTPLYFACTNRDLEMTRLLLKQSADPNMPTCGWTPIHYALNRSTADGDTEGVVRELVRHGARLESKGPWQRTAAQRIEELGLRVEVPSTTMER